VESSGIVGATIDKRHSDETRLPPPKQRMASKGMRRSSLEMKPSWTRYVGFFNLNDDNEKEDQKSPNSKTAAVPKKHAPQRNSTKMTAASTTTVPPSRNGVLRLMSPAALEMTLNHKQFSQEACASAQKADDKKNTKPKE